MVNIVILLAGTSSVAQLGGYMAHDTVVLAYYNLVAGRDGIPGASAA